MREAVRDWLSLMVKSALLILGGVLIVAGLVDLVVVGINARAATVLAIGLLLAVPPLGFAFRDALREARKGHRDEP